VIYTVLVLLYQLADCKPFEKTEPEETLDNLYNSIKNESCSLDMTLSVDDEKFVELCGDKIVPNLTNISDDQFLFGFQSYLCYSVYHNVRALCDPGHNQNSFTLQPFQTEPSKFCSSIPEINITDDCNTWLRGAGDMGTEDCNTVTKVIAAIMKDTDDLCSKECIKADKLDPICKGLVETSLILAFVSNNIVSPKETLPLATQEKTVNKTEKTESTIKSDVTSVDEIDTSENETVTKTTEEKQEIDTPETLENETVTKTTEEKQEFDTHKILENETVTKTTGEKQEIDTPEISENETWTKTKEEKKETGAAAVTHDTQVLKGDAEDQNENEKMSSVAEDKGEEKKVEEDEGQTEIVPAPASSATDDFTTEPLQTVTQKDKIEEALPNSNFQGSIKVGSENEEQSSFFSYFMMLSVVSIVAYLVFHNKQKIMALVLEGRRQQGGRRRSGGREYRKIDSNAEEREMIY